MNDEELIETMRESFTAVRSRTPLERIVRRSHAVRARRRIPGVAGTLAVAAGAAVAATALTPAGHRPAPPASAQLAAWTVVKQADGSIAVTIRELLDPSGLQAKLRADGVRASVIFLSQPSPCRTYHHGGGSGLISRMVTLKQEPRGTLGYVHPAAFPAGAGIQFAAGFQRGPKVWTVSVGPVAASAACTGS
jgi:hypothetical protein